MMEINDQDLSALWQQQQPPTNLARKLTTRIHRHRRVAAVRLFIEVVLSVIGVTLLLWPGSDGSLSPAQLQLIPFFAVFLVVSWTLILQRTSDRQFAASEPASVYAQLRLQQLRSTLRNLKIASVSAMVLLAYGLFVLMGAYAIGAEAWLDAATRLMAWTTLWGAGTWMLVTQRRRRTLREYRAVRRIASGRG